MIWGFTSLHTWELHTIAWPYNRHYFPQVLVSSTRIELREPIPKAYSHIKLWMKQLQLGPKGCTTLVILLFNSKFWQYEFGSYPGILRRKLSIPHNTIMDLNNVLSKIIRRIIVHKICICLSSSTNCVFHILREMCGIKSVCLKSAHLAHKWVELRAQNVI